MSPPKPPDPDGSPEFDGAPQVSGEITASARRARPRSVSSLLHDAPSESGSAELDVDLGSLRTARPPAGRRAVDADGDADDADDDGFGLIDSGEATRTATTREPSPALVQTGSREARPGGRGGDFAEIELSPRELDFDPESKKNQPDDEALPFAERPFGPYTLLRRLAFGGMGEVFLARRDTSLSLLGERAAGLARLVVIKRILNHMRRDEKHRRMFLDEARLQSALRSAHIVQIHDVGEVEGQVFLAMEHVHGPSWRALIDRCREQKQHIPLAYIVDMVIQACEGLSYAHNLVDVASGQPLRIVHRDINPHNVLVTYDGVVKLIDFGIAKSELRDQHTETGTIKGKFAYMSPEQSAAEPLDARSDLFAMGICLYELVTLTNPFKKGNIVLSLEAIQKLNPKPLSALRASASFLQPVVERMLRKDPDERFADCAEVAAMLRQLQHDGLVPEPKQPLSLWLRDLFHEEIQSHLRVLEATGSVVDVAVSSSVRLPKPPHTTPPVPPEPDVSDVPSPESLVHEGNGTGPTGALTARPSRVPWAAGLGLAVVVAAGIVGAYLSLRERAPIASTVTPPPPRVVVVDAGVASAAVVDAGAVAVAVADAGVAGVVDVVDAGAAGEPVGAQAPSSPTKKPRSLPEKPEKAEKSEKPEKPEKAEPVGGDIVGKVAVTAEGFVVKGSRAVSEKGALLVVDDADAPFKLRLKVTPQTGGGALLAVESEPWAIVRVDQVGRGKTPVRDVVLTAGKKTQLVLQNPGGASMEIAVTFAPTK